MKTPGQASKAKEEKRKRKVLCAVVLTSSFYYKIKGLIASIYVSEKYQILAYSFKI